MNFESLRQQVVACHSFAKRFEMLAQPVEACLVATLLGSHAAKALQPSTITDAAHYKTDGSPVTVADATVQAIVVAVLTTWGIVHVIAEEELHALPKPMLQQVIRNLNELFPRKELSSLLARTPPHNFLAPNWTEALVLETYNATRVANPSTLLQLQQQHYASQKTTPNQTSWTDRFYFVLDPIDGTKGYLRRGHYAVALALMDLQTHTPVASTIACPTLHPTASSSPSTDLTGDLFFAVKSQGAWRWSYTLCPKLQPGSSSPSQPLRLTLSNETRKSDTLIVVESFESRHTDFTKSSRVLSEYLSLHQQASDTFKRTQVLRLDSMAKYCLLAAGDAHLLLRFPTDPGYKEKIWDILPGYLLLAEAGGVVVHADGTAIHAKGEFVLNNTSGLVAVANTIVTASDIILEAVNRTQIPTAATAPQS